MRNNLWTFLFLLLVSNRTFGQDTFTDLITKNEKAVFSVFTYDNLGVPSGSGTGFFISSDGVGITNYHVLKDATSAIIKLNDKTAFKIIETIEANKEADIVKFKIENIQKKSFPFLTFKFDDLQKGEKIFVIGNPHGFESTVSEGIVSSIREMPGYEQVIQITAAISPGSSGSPVMTLDGKVIGIATYQFSDGQNLNFAVSSKLINKLSVNSKSYSAIQDKNLIVINEYCKENSELILNSIEYKSNSTVLNFSFTNLSLGYGDHMVIWSAQHPESSAFFIQDINSGLKFNTTGSTIGKTRETGTRVDLGESIRFKIYFPAISKGTKRINILEGLSGSWNFMDIDLTQYLNIEDQKLEDYSKQFALTKLEEKDYNSAKKLLSDRVTKSTSDHKTYNTLGIISFIMDNNYDALQYLTKAIEISPKNDIYYVNRKTVKERKGDIHGAIEDLSFAIKCRSTHPEYYTDRAQQYMDLDLHSKALSDYDVAISLLEDSRSTYKSQLLDLRGNCKTYLEDFSGACRDWNEALANSPNPNPEILEKIAKECK